MELEVMPDHVHILCEVPPHQGIAKFVRFCKGRSSLLLRQEFPALKSRIPTLWTHSTFISTVGGAPLAMVKQYIQQQKRAITSWKPYHPELSDVHSQVLQDVSKRVDLNELLPSRASCTLM